MTACARGCNRVHSACTPMHPGYDHVHPGGAPYGAPAGGPAGPTVAAGVDGCTEGTTQGTSRKLAVCWSPRLPYTSCHFEVCHDGVRGCA